MDIVGLISGFFYSIVYMVTRPCILCISASLFCLKTAFITAFMSLDLASSAIYFHIAMLWRALWGAVWGSMLIFTFPIRFLASIPREQMLEQSMYEMNFELQNLEWNRKEVEENLQAAVREYKMMESELAQFEQRHNDAISKIKRLEAELQDLKVENRRLKEIQGKEYWSTKGHVEADKDTSMASPTMRYSLKKKKDRKAPESVGSERKTAMYRSIFSAILSLLVGLIMSEAKQKEMCTPLVGALLTVVGISLKSVVQFFSTVKNKPASDAVALLSLNWFILGTLTYPALPRIARVFAPRVFSTMSSVLLWLGRSVPPSWSS